LEQRIAVLREEELGYALAFKVGQQAGPVVSLVHRPVQFQLSPALMRKA
jgi:hypothetical protein